MPEEPSRVIQTEIRCFRLRDIGIEPKPVLCIPGGKHRMVPRVLDITYQIDRCPIRGWQDEWNLYRMAVSGPMVGKDEASSSSGAIFWTVPELREAHDKLADYVVADATGFLTERRGEPVRMNENGVLRRV